MLMCKQQYLNVAPGYSELFFYTVVNNKASFSNLIACLRCSIVICKVAKAVKYMK